MAKKHGKKYLDARNSIDREHDYSPAEAISLLKENAFANFDETVELHIRTTLDPRQADQQIRSVVVLPHGTGRTVRVLVFAQGEAVSIAENAGADYVGGEDLAEKINGGWLEFDVALSTPDMMRVVGRLGRILGPRGLMPTPKAGTVVQADDLPRVINESKQGRIEFRLDRTANIHVPVGKVSFTEEQLLENLTAMVESIDSARPAGAKGMVYRRMVITSTMGPGIRLSIPDVLQLQYA